jgi:O-antigen/teichoic acid export membrane protein
VLVVALVVAGAGLVWFLAAYGVAALAGALVARRLVKEAVELRPRLPSGRVRSLLAGSLAYVAATAVHVVYFRSVMLVVSVEASAREAGYFATAFRLAEFFAAAAGVGASTATPALVRAAAAERLTGMATRLVAAAAGLGLVVATTIALAAPLIMRLLGGDALEPAVSVLRVEAIAIGLFFPVFAAGAALLVMRRHADLVIANVAGLAVALAAALALVPGHGARGGAIAAAAAEGVLFLMLGLALVRAARRQQ